MQGLGMWGERLAEKYLLSQGYEIIARNWRVVEGEIDVIARWEETLVFVEVKTRRSRAFGPPEEAVHPRKQQRLRKTAWRFLEAQGLLQSDWRIDVIAIERSAEGGVARFDHYQNAVDSGTE